MIADVDGDIALRLWGHLGRPRDRDDAIFLRKLQAVAQLKRGEEVSFNSG
jgi:hypothetical protein